MRRDAKYTVAGASDRSELFALHAGIIGESKRTTLRRREARRGQPGKEVRFQRRRRVPIEDFFVLEFSTARGTFNFARIMRTLSTWMFFTLRRD